MSLPRAQSADPPATQLTTDVPAARAFLAEMRSKAAAASKANRTVVRGKSGWLFFVPDLRSISVGPFWQAHAEKISRASNVKYADPLEPIVDLHVQLKQAGIRLLLVPVPAKAVVYPEQISDALRAKGQNSLPRLDLDHQQFYQLLARRGVAVIDLLPMLVKHSHDGKGRLYCKSDSHWSGRACSLTARAIVKQIGDPPWLQELTRTAYRQETRRVEIVGDLARILGERPQSRETLDFTFVGKKADRRLQPIEPWRESPVLLMGDSHTLVFHDPQLHAKGAGLADHLALQLGFPVDLVGVRGSGATATRITLLRRRDNLKGKKLVIWCFSVREFTESVTGWRKVPLFRE